MKTVKVSIICTAYNHHDFIRDALDGFVMQKTDFPFEVIVHDDASTDGTADIIREYAEKYPDIIKPIFQKENQFSKGVKIGKTFMWPQIHGEYVAMNEGDDYWTDPYKLQKQVDFMDAHPDFAVCFHPVRVVWQDGSKPDEIWPSAKYRFNKTVLGINDLLKHNFIQTNSVMYRWRSKDMCEVYPDGILPGDWFMHLLHAQIGKIGFIPDIMSVYRKHSGGIWYESGAMTDAFILRNAVACLKFYECVEKQFNCNKFSDRLLWVQRAVAVAVRNKQFDLLQQIAEMEPDLLNQFLPKREDTEDFKKRKKYQHAFNLMLGISIVELLIMLLGWLL